MHPAVHIAIEIYMWIGIGATVVLGLAALFAWAIDGSWMPVRAVLTADGARVRWLDANHDLHEADLPPHAHVVDEEVALYARIGRRDVVRAEPHAPLVRALRNLTILFAGLALAGIIASIVVLFIDG